MHTAAWHRFRLGPHHRYQSFLQVVAGVVLLQIRQPYRVDFVESSAESIGHRSSLHHAVRVVEVPVGARIRLGLEQEGFLVMTSADGHEGLRQARVGSFAAIVLGTALPGLDGYQVLHVLRAQSLWTPLIMVADEHDEVAQVDALNFGADDYLTKPFAVDVLVARLRALLRRGAIGQPIVLVAGSLCLNSVRRQVTRGSTVIKLTSREFSVLEYLMRHRDTVVTKTELRQNVWEPRYHDAVNLVEVYVDYLRRKIDAPFGTVTIRTIRGVGYRIDSE